MAIEKIKILGAVLELSAKQPDLLITGANFQCCLAVAVAVAPKRPPGF